MEENQEINSKVLTGLSMVAAFIAVAIARKSLAAGWKLATGRPAPVNLADPEITIPEAATFAALSGFAVAFAKMATNRRARNYYLKSKG